MRHSQHIITGKLVFSPRRVTLESGEERYFVRPFSLRDGYVHGDSVKARIAKRSDGDKLSEVEVVSLLYRSEEVLLATIVLLRGKKYLEVRREQGSFRIALPSDAKQYQVGDIIACKFLRDGAFKPLHRFARDGEYDIEERLILFLSGAHTEFSQTVIAESEALIAPVIEDNNVLSFRSNAEESLFHSLT